MSVNKGVMFFLGFFLLMLSFQLVAYRNNPCDEKTFMSSLLFSYSILLGAVVLSLADRIDLERTALVYKYILNVLLFFLLIELLLRILMQGGNEGFYNYKNGFMYYDSNFTGLVILSFLFFYHFLKRRGIYRAPRLSFFFLWVFLFLTFSRASVFAGLASILVLYNFSYIRLKSIVVFGGSFVVIALLFSMYASGVSFVEYDGSFNSKFNIIYSAMNYYLEEFGVREKLFGIGLGNTQYVLGIFAHNIFVTFALELGLVGASALVLFVTYLTVKTNGLALVVVVPNFVAGFSLFSAYSPFLFVCLALIYHHERMGRVK